MREKIITVQIIRSQQFSSNPPPADRNVPPVEPPGDDGRWHSNSLTGKRHCRPPRHLNGLFWRACHRGRGCGEDEDCKCMCTKRLVCEWNLAIQWKLIKARKSEESMILCYGQTIPFQSSGRDCSQKRLCLSQHMCEKRLVHSRLVTKESGGGNVHERKIVEAESCWCETYCSRTHPSGRGSLALHHTDNLLGCRCDRSGIQTAQGHTCRQDPWWL